MLASLRRLAPLALGLALAPPAGAAQRTIVVPDLIVTGPVDDAARAFFLAGVQDGVEATGSGLVAANTVRAALDERPDLGRCEDDRCLLSLARATRASAVVVGQVTKDAVRGEVERARYQVRLRLYDAEAADFTSVEEEGCARCSETELQALLRAVTRRLIERERHPETAPLEVISSPPEAEVRVDGRLLGLTDLAQSIAVGAHHLTVEKRGLEAARADISLAVGHPLRVTVRWPVAGGAALVEQGAPPRLGDATPQKLDEVHLLPVPQWSPRKPIGAALVAAGAVALAVGVALLAVNGNPTGPECHPTAAGEHCAERFTTTAGGVVSLIVGLAAIGGGVGLLITAQVGPRLAGATLSGRF